MNGLAEARTAATEPAERDTNAGIAKANGRALDFVFGVQRTMLEELVFAMTEVMDRARTETHLFNEFVSKMAASHSVKDIKTMWDECCQHQLDFIRRDCARLFKHGERMIETTSNLLGGTSEAGSSS